MLAFNSSASWAEAALPAAFAPSFRAASSSSFSCRIFSLYFSTFGLLLSSPPSAAGTPLAFSSLFSFRRILYSRSSFLYLALRRSNSFESTSPPVPSSPASPSALAALLTVCVRVISNSFAMASYLACNSSCSCFKVPRVDLRNLSIASSAVHSYLNSGIGLPSLSSSSFKSPTSCVRRRLFSCNTMFARLVTLNCVRAVSSFFVASAHSVSCSCIFLTARFLSASKPWHLDFKATIS
mmetsp:Transcript_5550/g.9926  ORF Transcript_5550/g.9926 Transcript_5550/m.9926 type:complete len:238 (+) Transcript_5550:1704-2417(+)